MTSPIVSSVLVGLTIAVVLPIGAIQATAQSRETASANQVRTDQPTERATPTQTGSSNPGLPVAVNQTAFKREADLRNIKSNLRSLMAMQTGHSLMKQGRYGAAASLLKEVCDKDPTNAPLLIEYGTMLRLSNRSAESKEQLLKAIELDKNSASCWLSLWLTYSATGEQDAAKSAYEQYLRIKPKASENANAKAELEANDLLLRGMWLIGENNSSESANLFRKGCELNPTSCGLQTLCGMLLTSLKRDDEAKPHYQKSIELAKTNVATDPSNAVAWDSIIVSSIGMGDLPAATTAIEQFLSLVPDGAPADKATEGQKCKDILVLLKSNKTTGSEVSSANSMDFQAMELMAHGNYEGAAAVLRPALKLVPSWALLHVDYGIALLNAHHTEEARAELEQATQLDTKFSPAWRKLGSLYQTTGQNKLAANAFAEYLRLEPGAPDAATIRQAVSSQQ